MRTERVGLVEFLNGEARLVSSLASSLDPAGMRRLLRAALSGRYDFPLRAQLRGYVVGSRDVAGPSPSPKRGQGGLVRAACGHYLEVVPAGFTKDAFDLAGPLLVPFDRRLDAGSVLDVEIEVVDPASYEAQPAGLFTRLASATVRVAVEA